MQLGRERKNPCQRSALFSESYKYGGLTSVRVGSDFPDTTDKDWSDFEADTDSTVNSDAYYANLHSKFEKLSRLIN